MLGEKLEMLLLGSLYMLGEKLEMLQVGLFIIVRGKVVENVGEYKNHNHKIIEEKQKTSSTSTKLGAPLNS